MRPIVKIDPTHRQKVVAFLAQVLGVQPQEIEARFEKGKAIPIARPIPIAEDLSMPQVASTPYLVTIAEIACARLVKEQLEAGQITVGTRVVIDHLGASKVGAELVIKAALLSREKFLL